MSSTTTYSRFVDFALGVYAEKYFTCVINIDCCVYCCTRDTFCFEMSGILLDEVSLKLNR